MYCDEFLALHNDDSVFRAQYHREEKESKRKESGGEGWRIKKE